MHYEEAFDALTNVYLADSWVLDRAFSSNGLAFRIEAVLAPEHPLYQSPRPGEQYCYRTVWLEVLSAAPVQLELRGALPTQNADGTSDEGNIDLFAQIDGTDRWVLDGDWGRAIVTRPIVKIEYRSDGLGLEDMP